MESNMTDEDGRDEKFEALVNCLREKGCTVDALTLINVPGLYFYFIFCFPFTILVLSLGGLLISTKNSTNSFRSSFFSNPEAV